MAGLTCTILYIIKLSALKKRRARKWSYGFGSDCSTLSLFSMICPLDKDLKRQYIDRPLGLIRASTSHSSLLRIFIHVPEAPREGLTAGIRSHWPRRSRRWPARRARSSWPPRWSRWRPHRRGSTGAGCRTPGGRCRRPQGCRNNIKKVRGLFLGIWRVDIMKGS